MLKKKNISSYILIIIISLLLVGCIDITVGSGPVVTGSRTLETQEMDYSGFEIIEASYAFQVEVTEASSFSVSITMNHNLFDYLVIEQSGDTLYLSLDSNNRYRNFQNSATITMPKLRELEVSGASKGTISGFNSLDSLQLVASGASLLNIDNVKAGNTNLNVSGASRVQGNIEVTDGIFQLSGASNGSLKGTADDIELEVSGASNINFEDFTVINASVEVSGASSAIVYVDGRLDVDVSGASRLYYTGSPEIGNTNVSDASSIQKR